MAGNPGDPGLWLRSPKPILGQITCRGFSVAGGGCWCLLLLLLLLLLLVVVVVAFGWVTCAPPFGAHKSSRASIRRHQNTWTFPNFCK